MRAAQMCVRVCWLEWCLGRSTEERKLAPVQRLQASGVCNGSRRGNGRGKGPCGRGLGTSRICLKQERALLARRFSMHYAILSRTVIPTTAYFCKVPNLKGGQS